MWSNMFEIFELVFSAEESLGESSLDLTPRGEVAAEAEPAREVRLNLKMMS